jgi:hypothetical protein
MNMCSGVEVYTGLQEIIFRAYFSLKENTKFPCVSPSKYI